MAIIGCLVSPMGVAMNRRMRHTFIAIVILVIVVWVGDQIFKVCQERSRVESLPKKVAVLGQYSAKSGIDEARRIASMWDPDCRLQCIRLAFGGDPHSDNQALASDGIPIPPSGWTYRFFSSTRGWFLDLTLWPDGRCDARSFNGINYLDTVPLPQEFLDSTSLLSIAEKDYGKRYREQGKPFRLLAELTTWSPWAMEPPDPPTHRPIWQIQYLTTRKGVRVDFILVLDAVTGEELWAAEFNDSKKHVFSNKYDQ